MIQKTFLLTCLITLFIYGCSIDNSTTAPVLTEEVTKTAEIEYKQIEVKYNWGETETIEIPYVDPEPYRNGQTAMFPDFTYDELRAWIATQIITSMPINGTYDGYTIPCWLFAHAGVAQNWGDPWQYIGIYGALGFFDDATIDGMVLGLSMTGYPPTHGIDPCDGTF